MNDKGYPIPEVQFNRVCPPSVEASELTHRRAVIGSFHGIPTPMGGVARGEIGMTHVHDTDVVRRLKSIEGHVRGVQRMVDDGAYCIDVVNQIVAIQRALKKVSGIMLDGHLHSCVTNAVRGPDVEAREQVLGELMQVFEASGKV